MSQFTQKYTIVQFFDDVNEHDTFSSHDWPLHSTIIDTFAIEWPVDEMAARLTKLLRERAMVNSRTQDDKYFGVNGQVQVTLLDRTESLMKLHLNVVTMLESGGLVLNDPQFAQDGFLPHVTVQKNARLKKGDEVQFTALSIVDMFPGGDPSRRKVLKTVKIGN